VPTSRPSPLVAAEKNEETLQTTAELMTDGTVKGRSKTTASGPFSVTLRLAAAGIEAGGRQQMAATQLRKLGWAGTGTYDFDPPRDGLVPSYAITGFFQLEQRPDLLDGKAFALPTELRFEKVDVHRPHAGQPQHPQVEIAVLINQDSAVVVAALPDHRALNNDLPNMITARRTARPRRILCTASARLRGLEASQTGRASKQRHAEARRVLHFN
jgi:hypothetical protein